MQKLTISEDDNILIIAPHPDDECIGAGGILVSHPKKCAVWVLTDGRIGQGSSNEQELIDTRKAEFLKEMNYLGIVSFKFFNVPDGTLIGNTHILDNEEFSSYSKIFVTWSGDGHADHTAAYNCLCNAMKAQKLKRTVYLYEVHQLLQCPSHYFEISDTIQTKQKLISFHASQIASLDYCSMVRDIASLRGHQMRMSGSYLEFYEERIIDGNDVRGPHNNSIDSNLEDLQKFKLFYRVMANWLGFLVQGKLISKWLVENGIHNIVVYGYADLGKLLCRDIVLNESRIRLLYVIDQKGSVMKDDLIEPIPLKNGLEKPDIVIVTADYYYEKIKNTLEEYGYQNIVSLMDILNSMTIG